MKNNTYKEITVRGITFAVETTPGKLCIIGQYDIIEAELIYIGEYRIDADTWDYTSEKDITKEIENIMDNYLIDESRSVRGKL